ncbi:uncharacterized protein LOC125242408 [Leguminivora glycinivorella]|uniref:uncharacterized protein LOC125242408 n=1 Tax=Leguminivora glycinivorella TaxID=1035111 RepID=UPI0020103020|nr:uncharacterized protein LOC125242408 [Leguminivora glycinivorella]
MPNHRNACTICFVILVFITCTNASSKSSTERDSSDSKSAEAHSKKPIQRQASTDDVKEKERNFSESDDDDSNSGADRSDGGVEAGPKITRGFLRDQVANQEGSDERRKKRHAYFYHADKSVGW